MMNNKISTKHMAFVGIMAAVLCVAGPNAIPIGISPVPITLANFCIYVSAILFGWKLSTLSTVIYLLLGTAGLPVFSGFSGGLGKLAGPTGGYLIGYIFVAFICGVVAEKTDNKLLLFLGLLVALIVIYIFGTVWLQIQTHTTFQAALAMGVYPYVILDLIKIVVAVLLVPPVKNRLYKSGIMD